MRYLLILLPFMLLAAPVCTVKDVNGTYHGTIKDPELQDVNFEIKIPTMLDLTVKMNKQTRIKLLNTIVVEEGIKEFKVNNDVITYTPNLLSKKHSIALNFKTVVGKKYVLSFKSSKPVWVYFSDGARVGHSPAKLTGGAKHITLDFLTATKTITELYFQPQTKDEITIKDISLVLTP